MKQVTIKEVKKGDFFYLKNDNTAPLWVRGSYSANGRVYSCYKYDDVNHEILAKGTRKVYIEDYE